MKKDKPEKVPAIRVVESGGLECDNPSCDWSDMTIKVEDYEGYINYECPKCGENVLTEIDYKIHKWLLRTIKIINFILPKRVPNPEKDASMKVEFKGNGRIETKIEKKEEDKNEED